MKDKLFCLLVIFLLGCHHSNIKVKDVEQIFKEHNLVIKDEEKMIAKRKEEISNMNISKEEENKLFGDLYEVLAKKRYARQEIWRYHKEISRDPDKYVDKYGFNPKYMTR
jgi:glutamate racemase